MKPSLTCLFAAVAMVCSSLAYGGSVRISAAEFVKDPAKVAALQKAVAAMKANNSADPTSTAYRASWQYWANTHGYLGLGSNSSVLWRRMCRPKSPTVAAATKPAPAITVI